jgi:hypothetical protein
MFGMYRRVGTLAADRAGCSVAEPPSRCANSVAARPARQRTGRPADLAGPRPKGLGSAAVTAAGAVAVACE